MSFCAYVHVHTYTFLRMSLCFYLCVCVFYAYVFLFLCRIVDIHIKTKGRMRGFVDVEADGISDNAGAPRKASAVQKTDRDTAMRMHM